MNEKFFIYTLGCKINQYESQIIREKFISEGYIPADSLSSNPDIVIINSCSVTSYADKQCNHLIKKLLTQNPQIKVILTGCYAKVSGQKILNEFPEIKIILKDDILKDVCQKIKSFDNHSRAFIKIQDGCNSFCSYCIVPYARDKMWSKPVSEIIDEINSLTDAGYCEMVLTGIHLGKYETGISALLKQLFDSINKEFRIRLSSIEINEIDDDLISLLKNEPVRLCNHLHIPLQSGCDKILKDMNRKYTAKDFYRKIDKVRNILPDISVTADVICGFPTETADDFEDTYKFIQDINFSRLHVFPYSARSGTKAFNFKKVYDSPELKIRTDKLLALDKILRQKYHSKFAGQKRMSVSLMNNQALTDNYITIKNIKKKKGIFLAAVK